ncbi:MAG: hypothetical protein ACQGVC_18310, partial [Myxococcota bacterium]
MNRTSALLVTLLVCLGVCAPPAYATCTDPITGQVGVGCADGVGFDSTNTDPRCTGDTCDTVQEAVEKAINQNVEDMLTGSSTAGQVPTADGAGGLTMATPSGTGHTIEDEGTPLTQRGTINFTGSGIACSDDAGDGETDCVVSSGGSDGLGPDGDKGDITVGGTGTTATIDTDAVGSDELDAPAVATELEAAMALQDISGAVTDAQVPDDITITDDLRRNVVLDTDGDGNSDHVIVGDYDGDGTLEMVDDLQAAYDAVTIWTGPVANISAFDAASCTGSNDCIQRDDGGSFVTDGFTTGMEVFVSGFDSYRFEGAAAAEPAACPNSDSCFTRASGSFVTDGWLAGQRVYPMGYRESRAETSNEFGHNSMGADGCLVTAVAALTLDVDCDLETEAADGDEVLWGDGNNGIFTIEAVSASEMSLSRTGASTGAELTAETSPDATTG